MSKFYKVLPSSLWGFDSSMPKGYYLNRGVWAFGTMVENDMQVAESRVRRQHKGASSGDKFINSERLRVLGIHLQEDIKRFKEPGAVTSGSNKNTEQTLGDDFFKLKTK
jgi:hypothetical protein